MAYSVRTDRRSRGKPDHLHAVVSSTYQSVPEVDVPAQPREVRLDVDLHASIEIIAWGAGGEAERPRLTVESITCADAEVARALARGAVVLVQRDDGRLRFTDDAGAPCLASVAMRLEAVVSVDDGIGGVDGGFDMDARRKIGESWPIRADRAAAGLLRHSCMRAAPADISGQVSILGTAMDLAGEPCLRLETTMRVAAFSSVRSDGEAADTGTSLSSQTLLLPIDPSLPWRSFTSDLTVTTREAPGGRLPTITTVTRHAEVTYSPP